MKTKTQTKPTGNAAPTSNAMTMPPKQTRKGTETGTKKAMGRKPTPDDLYIKATARADADPRAAMRTAANALDLLELITIMTEKSAGASTEFAAPNARAAFLAFLLRLDAEKGPVCTMQATIKETILPGASVYRLENDLTWRNPANGLERKIAFHIVAEL